MYGEFSALKKLVNANNHVCDSAVIGLLNTLDAMDEKGFMHTGTFHPEGDERIPYVKKGTDCLRGRKDFVRDVSAVFERADYFGRGKILNYGRGIII